VTLGAGGAGSAAGSGSAIVVGAGIVGICAALELQRRGQAVTLVDRLDPAEACSFGNAGILAAQAVVPLALPGIHKKVPGMLLDPEGPLVVRRRGLARTVPWVWHLLKGARADLVDARADAMKALYATTVELHEGLAREAGVPELIVPGRYLYLYKRREAVDVEKELSWRLRRDRGSEIEVFDGNGAIRELEPAVSTIYQRAVRLGPSARTTNPYRLTRAYADLFRRKGGDIRRAEVRMIAPGRPVAIETSVGRMQAETLVVAGGSWSTRLLEPLGVRFPLIAERGYHMTFADPGLTLTHMCNDPDRHVAVTSMEMGLRVAGTEELGDPDDPPSWRRADVMRGIAAEMLPGADLSKGSRWMGPRPGTPDGIPAIGAVPGHPNILVGFGHGHLGLTGGPATGRLIAQLVTGERPNIDLSPFGLERFARRRQAARA
jgi:D-amino-acid dehydrogenase